MRNAFFLFAIWIIFCPIFGKSQQKFDIYIKSGAYANQPSLIKLGYIPYKILLQHAIDPRNNGSIDEKSVLKRLEELFPKKNANGFLSIDLENKLYRDLRDFSPGHKRYEHASNAFINLIKTIKNARPNIKVGVYGLPFRVYFRNQKQFNSANKLDKILKYCDYLSPSLYIMYTNNQVGKSRNLSYLKENLSNAFSLAKKLNKPVIPFFWYLIHPSNKIYGNNLIKKEDIYDYMDVLGGFTESGKRIDGIIWWESSKRYLSDNLNSKLSDKNRVKPEVLVKEYTSKYLRTKK